MHPPRIALYSLGSTARAGGGLTYSGGVATLLSQSFDVTLFVGPRVDGELLRRHVLDGAADLRIHNLPPLRAPRGLGPLAHAWQARAFDLVIRQALRPPVLNLRGPAVLLTDFPLGRPTRRRDPLALASYREVWVNGSFTARHVEDRWGCRAEVLHPCVAPLGVGKKEPWILAVGRFCRGGRGKRQEEMIAALRHLPEVVRRGWQLHLAGFAEDEAFLAELRAAAVGLPVVFHVDVSRSALVELYRRAALFWHFTGMGVDAEREPERVEHFGIVTVEAQSAGCVPIVYGAGGQEEIVGASGGGVVWRSLEACLEATRRLVARPDERECLGRLALESARRFSPEALRARAEALVWRALGRDAPLR